MTHNTITLALDGNVSFREFATALDHFYRLIDALATQLHAKEGVEWFIDDLAKSSAMVTIRGESESPNKVQQVVDGYAKVGRALQNDAPIPYSRNVSLHAHGIRDVINEQVTSVRFETAEADITISRYPAKQLPSIVPPAIVPPAYGAIEGRIQALTNRTSLRFTLFDSRHDRAVSCYLEQGQEDIMREVWGHRAIVEGLVTRDPASGRPVAIRRISAIEIMPEGMSNYREARGIVTVPDDALPPEEIIRRLRDG